MTIQVQHHEPNVLITNTSCTASSEWKSPIETVPLTSSADDFMAFHKPLQPYGSRPDDDDSVMTLSSTASLSDSESNNSISRVVTFAPELVTEEWTRPFTPTEDLGKLYYSSQETQRFRQEYRLERKQLNTSPALSDNVDDLWEVPLPQSRFGTRGISRVVVVHNDTLATFSSPSPLVGCATASSGCSENSALTAVGTSVTLEGEQAGDFFDTPEFWSGSITWW